MLNENQDFYLDIKQIEDVAKDAMRNARLTSGRDNIQRDIAVAIAAAIAEYDRQKSQ